MEGAWEGPSRLGWGAAKAEEAWTWGDGIYFCFLKRGAQGPAAARTGHALTSFSSPDLEVASSKGSPVPASSLCFPLCFLSGSVIENLPANAGDTDSIPDLGRSPGEMATHSSILTWKFPWSEETGGLQPMGMHKSWTRFRD